jgi:hypothetical protein
MSSVVIERHVKIQADANPYDPKYEQYFEKRLHVKMTKGQVGKTKLARRLSENTDEKLSSRNSFPSNFYGTTVNYPIKT